MIDFSGQRVVVTGAGGGVGRALCATFAGLGAAVVGYDIDAGALDRLDLAEARGFDLMDAGALADAVRGTLDAGPAPAAVISNAGWTRAETLDQLTDESFRHELDLNLTTGAALSRAFRPAMRAAGGGAFVFVSSINALSHFGNPAYAAAKAGLIAWMRAIATEDGWHGIRANAILPGSIRTAAWDHRFQKYPGIAERVQRLYPLGRLVEPEEVARAAAFLASPMASGITGAALAVDAGLSAGNMPFLAEIAPPEES